MITLKCFDAKEPSNTNGDRRSYGNNRYSQSNIDQWLNSQAASWYSARHSYDAPPNNANVWSNYNEYDTEAGFLSNFEADFRKAILDAVIRVAKNTVTDGGGYEDITRKVFLLSNTEVGLSNENSVAEGALWSYFSSAARRQCYPTAEAVSNSEYTNSSLNASSYWYWWLRTPYAGYADSARVVGTDGSLAFNGAYYGTMAFGRLSSWNLGSRYPWSQTRLNFPLPPCWPNSLRNSLSKKSFAESPKARKTVTTMKKTTFKQCAAGDVFEHQGQALIKTTKPNTAVNLNSGAFAHFHDGSLVDRSDLVLIHQADLPSKMPDSLKGGRNNG